MTKNLNILFLTIIGFTLMQSCAMEKRKYNRGWHVTPTWIKNGSAATKSTDPVHSKRIQALETSEVTVTSESIPASNQNQLIENKSRSAFVISSNILKDRAAPKIDNPVNPVQKDYFELKSEHNFKRNSNSYYIDGDIFLLVLFIIVVLVVAGIYFYMQNGWVGLIFGLLFIILLILIFLYLADLLVSTFVSFF